jgi:hypothetical protein
MSARCSHCHEEGLVFGTLQSTGAVHFRPTTARFLTFRTADIALKVGMCPACGLLTLVGDREKLRLLRGDPPTPSDPSTPITV